MDQDHFDESSEAPVEIPINGVLDLHAFRPKDVPEVVDAYLEACLEAGIRDVRVVHGKGIGTIREMVHSRLSKHPLVETFGLGGSGAGEWGATVVRLKSGS